MLGLALPWLFKLCQEGPVYNINQYYNDVILRLVRHMEIWQVHWVLV